MPRGTSKTRKAARQGKKYAKQMSKGKTTKASKTRAKQKKTIGGMKKTSAAGFSRLKRKK